MAMNTRFYKITFLPFPSHAHYGEVLWDHLPPFPGSYTPNDIHDRPYVLRYTILMYYTSLPKSDYQYLPKLKYHYSSTTFTYQQVSHTILGINTVKKYLKKVFEYHSSIIENGSFLLHSTIPNQPQIFPYPPTP